MVSQRALEAILDQSNVVSTCPSSYNHGDIVDGVLDHYLGCLPYRERERYFNSLSDQEQEEIRVKMRRIEWIRREMINSDEKSPVQSVQSSLKRWRNIRQTGQRYSPRLEESLHGDKDELERIPSVSSERPEVQFDDFEPYDPDLDTLAHVILLDKNGHGFTDKQTLPDESAQNLFYGEFPNQTIPVATLLRNPTINPLIWKQVETEPLRTLLFMNKIYRAYELSMYLRDTQGSQLEAITPSFEAFSNARRTLGFGPTTFPWISKRQIVGRNALGQLLYDASLLYVEMRNYRDAKLIENYMEGRSPMHPRRTLYQAYYWSKKYTDSTLLSQSTTAEQPDLDLIGTKKTEEVIMADQLWLWVLADSTVLSCFPSRYGADKDNNTEIHRAVRMRIAEEEERRCIRSAYDLALIILNECCHSLLDPARLYPGRPLVLNTLSQALSEVEHSQEISFRTSRRLAELQFMISAKDPGEVDPSVLARISLESGLHRETNSILDQLDAMIHVHKSQREMLRRFKHNAETLLRCSEKKKTRRKEINSQGGSTSPRHEDEADSLLQRAQDQLGELENIHEIAERVSKSIDQLIEFKTQQASAIQAMQSVWLSRKTVQQGRAIMAFTVVTIVFVGSNPEKTVGFVS
ncbi:Fc.00g012810.m01.CDS01 [Cosmosporella sp. VM-42]